MLYVCETFSHTFILNIVQSYDFFRNYKYNYAVFLKKSRLKMQKIAEYSLCVEFQMIVAAVGI